MAFIVSIVEGHGEIDALPALLHRIRDSLGTHEPLTINRPIRVKSGSFLNRSDEFRRYVAQAVARAATASDGSVLILLDCEDDCPATLGPRLLRDATEVDNRVRTFVALAYREYESWLLAAAPSLAGKLGLPPTLTAPADIDRIRDAKGWLGARMPAGYDPIRHQAPLTRAMAMDMARKVPSFERLYQHMARLLSPLATPISSP